MLQRAQSLVARVADDLVRERRSLDSSVSGLLAGGWSGVAAEEYQQAWAAYLAGDDDSVATVAPLDERLRERLS